MYESIATFSPINQYLWFHSTTCKLMLTIFMVNLSEVHLSRNHALTNTAGRIYAQTFDKGPKTHKCQTNKVYRHAVTNPGTVSHSEVRSKRSHHDLIRQLLSSNGFTYRLACVVYYLLAEISAKTVFLCFC